MTAVTDSGAASDRAGHAYRGSVVIIGAGLMGAQIGLEYALGGYQVSLVTRTPASHGRAMVRASDAARVMVRARLIRASERTAALHRIIVTSDPGDALADASLVVESVDEDLELKTDVLRRAAQANPTATLASNTSALSISTLGDRVGAPERIVGTHYWNPPTLMPLVEVVAGRDTELERVADIQRILRKLGKDPIIVPDIPGFLWNRLQLALIREAVALVREGTTTPDVVDRIARYGFGRRWNLIGPFASIAAGGVSTVARVADLIYPTLGSALDGDDIRALQLASDGPLAASTAERDLSLARRLREDREDRNDPSERRTT